MDLLAAIFDQLMRMTPHFTDTESRAERQVRMHIVAVSINDATKKAACVGAAPGCKPILSDRRLLAGLLIGKGHFESDFAQYVHEGHCEAGPVGARCDSDKDGIPRAHGPWQSWIQGVIPRDDWDKLVGVTPEATHLAAWHAAKILAGMRSMCKEFYGGDEIQSAIAGYSGSCTRMDPKKVAYQAQAVRKIMALLPSE